MTTRRRNSIKLYCAGGAGANIGKRFENLRDTNDVGFGKVEMVYMDTSDSNLKSAHIPQEAIYLFPNMDGSGGERAENHEEIASRTLEILQLHKPADLNIVISSLAGGSGSVIAPYLAKELAAKGQAVIVIGISNTATTKWTRNSKNTILSYESFASRNRAGMVLALFDNDKGRTVADEEIYTLITSLTVLFSGQNEELDSKDLYNFLRFDKMSDFPASALALSTVSRDNKVPASAGNIATVATLAVDHDDTAINAGSPISYQCVGFIPEELSIKMKENAPFHFVVSDGPVRTMIAALDEKLAIADDAVAARVHRPSLLTGKENVTDTGFVL